MSSHLKIYCPRGIGMIVTRNLFAKTVLDLNLSKITWPRVRLQKFETVLANKVELNQVFFFTSPWWFPVSMKFTGIPTGCMPCRLVLRHCGGGDFQDRYSLSSWKS